MYTILMQQDKELIATVKTMIFEKENGVDTIRFLVPPYYNDLKLTDCIVLLKYVTPDRRNLSEKLTLQEELYKGYADYRLNVSTKLTFLPGDVDLRLSFIKPTNSTDNDESKNIEETTNDNQTECPSEEILPEVLHTGTITLTISQIKNPYDFNCEGSLEAIDQIVANLDTRINELKDVAEAFDMEKADDIEEENGEIWVTANGEKIGDPIKTKPKWDTF